MELFSIRIQRTFQLVSTVYSWIIVVNTKVGIEEKKHSGYPSRSATTKSKVNQSGLRRTRTKTIQL